MVRPSEGHAAVTVRARRDDAVAYVDLSGEIDLGAESMLAEAASQLEAAAPAAVVFDLAGITFADSMLANFIALVRRLTPAGTPLLLCRPSPMTRHILEVSVADVAATLSEELPAMSRVTSNRTHADHLLARAASLRTSGADGLAEQVWEDEGGQHGSLMARSHGQAGRAHGAPTATESLPV